MSKRKKRLEKLFGLLGSENESEAMSALRFIRQEVTKAQTWNEFVRQLVEVGFGIDKEVRERCDAYWEDTRYYGGFDEYERRRKHEQELKAAAEALRAKQMDEWEQRQHGWRKAKTTKVNIKDEIYSINPEYTKSFTNWWDKSS